jgi:hypothetical protein
MRAVVIHICLAVVWVALLVPTILWWKNSILWIGFMSGYAIIGMHVDGAQSALAAYRSKDD